MRASVAVDWPKLGSRISLWCEISTGVSTASPMAKVSSMEAMQPSASLRMCVTYSACWAPSGRDTPITSSVLAAAEGG